MGLAGVGGAGAVVNVAKVAVYYVAYQKNLMLALERSSDTPGFYAPANYFGEFAISTSTSSSTAT